ncbi:hypothetical protein Bca52824_036514 [Brassica carinata]|uniref:G protein gamma domain-containing protein n=1 Tax=Brassica carinata TaxID=52824 RepID=A0A8X7S5G3_BRACI|nr:hypothetical protein Bca52824_036514 [Brassica carinata]
MASTSGSLRGEVTGETSSALAPSSLPPPRPKSPPEYPDLYGKRRAAARVQMLEREIGFLEAKIKFIEGVQPASRCCKEVSDFVVANSDPLIPTVEDTAGSGSGSGNPSAATAQVAAALGPNAVTDHAAQIYVVARSLAVRAVHASEVAVVLVRTYLAAYPPVSAVALDRPATARSDGHLVLDVPRYDFVVVLAAVKIFVLILVV